MKKVSRYFCQYKREVATCVQRGPSWVVRTKVFIPEEHEERRVETPDCADLVIGGNIELADSADSPLMALCRKYGMGGQA